MELYAAGFNAWNQLCFTAGTTAASSSQGEEAEGEEQQQQQPGDLHVFTYAGLRVESIGDVTPFLSYTSVQTSDGVKTAGMIPAEHDALRGRCRRGDLFAEAANGTVVVVSSSDARTAHQYASIAEALQGPTRSQETYRFPADVTQLVAYDAGFAALAAATGEVWTWGDDRYPASLGRDATTTAADDSSASTSPASSRPGRVLDLEDLPTGKIAKIAAGGYVLAALTRGGDLYCWGGHPGRKPLVEGIVAGPVPVVADEDSDVVDMGVGESHLVVLSSRGEVFVIGENGNGQLGLGESAPSAGRTSWTQVPVDLPREDGVAREIVGVAAGPRCSFIKVRIKSINS